MKYRCRCIKWRCRRTFSKHPDELKRPPLCGCGCGTRQWRVDHYRMRKEEKDRGKVCSCTGRILQHRYGQSGCIHREDAVITAALMGRRTASDESWLIDK